MRGVAALAIGLALLAPAAVEAKVVLPAASTGDAGPPVKAVIGYLGLTGDPRHAPFFANTEIQLRPADNPLDGAKLGLDDEKIIADAVNMSFTLDPEDAKDVAGLMAKLRAMVENGEHFVLLDLPGDLAAEVAKQAQALKVTLINVSAPDNALRQACYTNLLDTAASDRQETDALVQLLVSHNWTKVLVLEGASPRDRAYTQSFVDSAGRLRLNIVDTRQFTLSKDPMQRGNNNTLLITGNADYDVVFVADFGKEFDRYLPYQTQLARPVIGTTGLVPSEWHWSWDRYGAPQVQHRFEKRADGRHMSGADWAAWVAVKTIIDSYARASSTKPVDVDKYLRSDNLRSDGSKGQTLNYRPWSGQMRQPILLTTADAVITDAPLPGFENQSNNLDTLGEDKPESKCP
jgi:ABC transporter substrate binding protein (PQQ-dependent alcohol dehydrogenase system)